jgi:hypothetical protein
LLLGQLLYLPHNSLHGFYNFYYCGYLEGYLRHKYGSSYSKKFFIVIDVCETKNCFNETWEYLLLDEALDKGIISKTSDLYAVMRKYELNYILIGGSSISGPSVDMIDCLEKLYGNYSFKKVLDLFSGTGSLSKVCIVLGAEYAECVDANTSVISNNLGDKAKYCRILCENAFSYEPKKRFDLVILEPFYDQSLEVAERLLPKFAGRIKWFLFNISGKRYQCWCSLVCETIKRKANIIKIFEGKTSMIVFGNYE